MSARAMRMRNMLATHIKRVVFSTGEQDTFDDAFVNLTANQRKRYDALGESLESSQTVMDWYGRGPKDMSECPSCKEECLTRFNYCPACGTQLRVC